MDDDEEILRLKRAVKEHKRRAAATISVGEEMSQLLVLKEGELAAAKATLDSTVAELRVVRLEQRRAALSHEATKASNAELKQRLRTLQETVTELKEAAQQAVTRNDRLEADREALRNERERLLAQLQRNKIHIDVFNFERHPDPAQASVVKLEEDLRTERDLHRAAQRRADALEVEVAARSAALASSSALEVSIVSELDDARREREAAEARVREVFERSTRDAEGVAQLQREVQVRGWGRRRLTKGGPEGAAGRGAGRGCKGGVGEAARAR
jgi:chromosome segregation ATPase